MYKRFASLLLILAILLVPATAMAQNESGSIGIEGTIPSDPPTVPATISSPTSGSVFTNVPITVTGICPDGLLIKLFKNGVFAGSAQCIGGNYSIQTDLFSGENELVAIVFDALDQEGPSSNIVTVTYNDNAGISPLERVTLNSNFARRGADPGSEISWPISVSGGQGPYAISINWGDGTDDLISVQIPGEFTATHAYETSGIYTIIVKATDSEGRTGYLQLVGVGNGPLTSTVTVNNGETRVETITKTRILWQPLIILIPLIIITFWLGRRYELRRIRTKIEAGELPFNLR